MLACKENAFSIQHEQAMGGPNTCECQATERLRVRRVAIRNLERHRLEKHYARACRNYGSRRPDMVRRVALSTPDNLVFTAMHKCVHPATELPILPSR